MSGPAFVVHFDEDGNVELYAFGPSDTRFLVIDERTPHDRVYRMTVRSPRSKLAELLRDDPIGDASDERHAALSHAIQSAVEGRPHLSVVPSDG
jgi:hypothetical protein